MVRPTLNNTSNINVPESVRESIVAILAPDAAVLLYTVTTLATVPLELIEIDLRVPGVALTTVVVDVTILLKEFPLVADATAEGSSPPTLLS
jgi:hypothetical protein